MDTKKFIPNNSKFSDFENLCFDKPKRIFKNDYFEDFESIPLFNHLVFPNEIVEIYGTSSSGKTQLSMTLTANAVQKNWNVFYIDTLGGFCLNRLKTILINNTNFTLNNNLKNLNNKNSYIKKSENFHIRKCLKKIYLIKAFETKQLFKSIFEIKNFLVNFTVKTESFIYDLQNQPNHNENFQQEISIIKSQKNHNKSDINFSRELNNELDNKLNSELKIKPDNKLNTELNNEFNKNELNSNRTLIIIDSISGPFSVLVGKPNNELEKTLASLVWNLREIVFQSEAAIVVTNRKEKNFTSVKNGLKLKNGGDIDLNSGEKYFKNSLSFLGDFWLHFLNRRFEIKSNFGGQKGERVIEEKNCLDGKKHKVVLCDEGFVLY